MGKQSRSRTKGAGTSVAADSTRIAQTTSALRRQRAEARRLLAERLASHSRQPVVRVFRKHAAGVEVPSFEVAHPPALNGTRAELDPSRLLRRAGERQVLEVASTNGDSLRPLRSELRRYETAGILPARADAAPTPRPGVGNRRGGSDGASKGDATASANDGISTPQTFLESLRAPSETGDRFELGRQNIDDDAFYDFWFFRRFFANDVELVNTFDVGSAPAEPGTPAGEPEPIGDEPLIYEVEGARAALAALGDDDLSRIDALYEAFIAACLAKFDSLGGVMFHGVERDFYRHVQGWSFVFEGLHRLLAVFLSFPTTEAALVHYTTPEGRLGPNGFRTVSCFGAFAADTNAFAWTQMTSSYPGYLGPNWWARVELINTAAGPLRVLVPEFARLSSAFEPLPTSKPADPESGYESARHFEPARVPAWLLPLNGRGANFGLRLTYRQQWQHIGNQFGPPLKTIPLGPGQKETVSIKVTRRDKTSRTVESSESSETVTESSKSVKDSTEIVEEASKMFKWKLDQHGEGGFDCGLWNVGGSTDISLDEESRNSSKEAKASVSESMEKSTSKVRRETKVVVSLESETTIETSTTSELHNANDELAVTYIYQMLQKQYAINSYFAEVTPVVLVAEQVPFEIDFEWLTRNAAVLEQNLLDETYRDVLAALRSTTSPTDASAGSAVEDAYNALRSAVAKATTALGQMPSSGGSFDRIFDSAFAEFARVSQEQARSEESRLKFKRLVEALSRHVVQNLLHYMQAVWASEAKEMRAMRYRGINVPTNFYFVPQGDVIPAGPGVVQFAGQWEVAANQPELQSLADLIDPSGPITFHENYAVFALRSSPTATALKELVAYHRLFYSTPPRVVQPGGNEWVLVDLPHRLKYGKYMVRFTRAGQGVDVVILRQATPVTTEEIARGTLPQANTMGRIGGGPFLVRVTNLPPDGHVYSFTVIPPTLEDPELREVRFDNPLPAEGSPAELAVFSHELLVDMLEVIPGLRGIATDGDRLELDLTAGWSELPVFARDVFRRYYHEYLVRKRNLRYVVVDTNNVVVNLFTGKESALEPFKRAHRYLDVRKAELELERRRRLLDRGDLADPDIETVVRVDGPTAWNVAGAAASSLGPSDERTR